MDFSEVENLKEEDVIELYDDIMKFGDDNHLAGCCCASGTSYASHARLGCRSWCRSLGSTCTGWFSGAPICTFRC